MQPLDALTAARRHSSELARITAGLLVGTLALMTFLLSVGLQHPKKSIEVFLYAAFILLGLSLVVYEVASLFRGKAAGLLTAAPEKDKDKAAAAAESLKSAQRWVSFWHGVQRALFLLSVVAVIGFALTSTSLFFPKPVQPAVPQSSGQSG